MEYIYAKSYKNAGEGTEKDESPGASGFGGGLESNQFHGVVKNFRGSSHFDWRAGILIAST